MRIRGNNSGSENQEYRSGPGEPQDREEEEEEVEEEEGEETEEGEEEEESEEDTEEPDPDPDPDPDPQVRTTDPQDRREFRPFLPGDNPAAEALAEELQNQGIEAGRIVNLLDRFVQHTNRSNLTAHEYSNAYQRELAEVAPDWFREHQHTIRDAENYVEQNLRGLPGSALQVFLSPAIAHANKTGDVAGALRMIEAGIKKEKGGTPSAPKKPAKELQASERIPTGGSGASVAPPQQPIKRTRGAAGVLAKLCGMDVDEAATYVPHLPKRTKGY